jgi:hypothetical protein
VRFIAKHEAAADNSHHFRTHCVRRGEMLFHFFCSRSIRAPFQSIRMSPGNHPLQRVFVQLLFDSGEVVGSEGRHKTGFQGDPLSPQSDRFINRLVELPPLIGVDLIGIDLAKKTMVTVTVDAHLHEMFPPSSVVTKVVIRV